MTGVELERRSVPEAIADVIHDRIMGGDLAPGERLREAGMATEFTASRNTVREAFLLLESRGLIDRSAHRGTKIVQPDEADILEIMAIRKVVEPGAVRRLCGLEAPRYLSGLRHTARELERAAAAGSWVRYGTLDLAFHAALVRNAGGPALGEGFEALVRPLYVHFLAVDRSEPAGPRQHVEEHARLVALIDEGAGAEAVALIDRHLEDAETALRTTPG